MKQVIIEDAKEGPKLKEVPIPTPGPNEVLVKVECAPLMPLDRLFTLALFPFPHVLGAQASGTIVKAGKDVPADCLNKKVQICTSLLSFSMGKGQGTWTQYIVKPFSEVYIYNQSISHEAACVMYENPLTAMGLVKIVKESKTKCVIIAPGAAMISKMVANLLKTDGIKSIAVVRSEETAKILKDSAFFQVLNSSDPSFDAAFAKALDEFAPTVLVDAVSNAISTKMFLQMPKKSMLLVYGAISGEQAMTLPTFPIVMGDKMVRGYYRPHEDVDKPRKEIVEDLKLVDEDLAHGGKIFGVLVVRRYEMVDFKKAIEEQPSYASKGLGIIKLN